MGRRLREQRGAPAANNLRRGVRCCCGNAYGHGNADARPIFGRRRTIGHGYRRASGVCADGGAARAIHAEPQHIALDRHGAHSNAAAISYGNNGSHSSHARARSTAAHHAQRFRRYRSAPHRCVATNRRHPGAGGACVNSYSRLVGNAHAGSASFSANHTSANGCAPGGRAACSDCIG